MRIRQILAAAAVVLAGALPAGSTMTVRTLSFETTTQEAERIIYGKTVEVRSGTDESGMPATWVTFDIKRTLKGRSGTRVTIKQFGSSEVTSGDLVTNIPDLPRYTAGEEVIVFLRGESTRGFTSPVGFEGGVYRVASQDGRRVARSGTIGETTDVEQLLARIAELVASQPSK